ncbi:hypothetical protein BX666DRAFT_1944384 [Dichotomocladium elegans]|nr:hypothetical protein BX666DRAFT_1944384 [Dichotomocladium elegans]
MERMLCIALRHAIIICVPRAGADIERRDKDDGISRMNVYFPPNIHKTNSWKIRTKRGKAPFMNKHPKSGVTKMLQYFHLLYAQI